MLAARWPCLDWLHAVPNGGFRNPREAARMRREGVTPGIADLFLPWPQFDDSKKLVYCGLYIEVKTSRGKQTAHQKRFQEYCGRAKYQYVLVRSAQEGIDVLMGYLTGGGK